MIRRFVLVVTLVSVLLGFGAAADATAIFIDQFTITKNGAAFFSDPFTDGNPPPNAPNFANGTPASYSVSGMLDEADGRVRMDTNGAAIVPGAGIATGTDVYLEQATLRTNIDPTNTTLGLKSNHTFSMSGLFDLAVPDSYELYGIRFHDFAGDGDDVLRLQVGPPAATGGIPEIIFTRQMGTTVTGLAAAPLDPTHEQIELTLSKNDADSNAITASFRYFDGGVAGPTTTFLATANLFSDENWTQGSFFFVAPVPEPASLVLLATALAGAGGVAWRRRR